MVAREERSVGLVRVGGFDSERCGHGSFDHGESCNNGTVRVADLLIRSTKDA